MTDVSVGEMPIEPVPSIPPGPEATAELERAVQAAEVPAGDTGEVETEVVESFDPRVSIPETLGPVRRAILEGLIDGEGALSVAELHALMPLGTPRGTVEAAILRESRSGRIERVGPGLYVLAKPKPAEQPKSARQPPPTPIEEATWFAALDGWINDPETWDRERFGPRPDEPGRRIPAGVVAKGVDRNRKRAARRKEAEAAQARQSAADQETAHQTAPRLQR
jgi:hypothetical protein